MSYAPSRPDPRKTPALINLFSDTQTKPSPAMREAMARADVGDEQRGEDATVNALCERMADLLGKEAALFLPSGTMCNVVATLTHCRPGDEILAHETAHILTAEGGAHAALGGFQITILRGDGGQFSADTLRAALRPRNRYAPNQRLVEVEQTANIGGGTIWPKAVLADISRIAKDHGLSTHMDGARLMNACVAANVSARDFAQGWDSVWLDFTKGLGAPIGAVLAGSRDFIDEAWRWKQRLGGAMRQAGIAAAGCLYALDHNVERLADDHTHARALARGLKQIPGIAVEDPPTNLVFFDARSAGVTSATLVAELETRGILVSQFGERIRACTHLDVTAAMIEETIAAIRTVVNR
jgi:threonine aldolase